MAKAGGSRSTAPVRVTTMGGGNQLRCDEWEERRAMQISFRCAKTSALAIVLSLMIPLGCSHVMTYPRAHPDGRVVGGPMKLQRLVSEIAVLEEARRTSGHADATAVVIVASAAPSGKGLFSEQQLKQFSCPPVSLVLAASPETLEQAETAVVSCLVVSERHIHHDWYQFRWDAGLGGWRKTAVVVSREALMTMEHDEAAAGPS